MTRLADLVRAAMLSAALIFLATGNDSDALRALLVIPPSLAARVVRVHPVLDLVFALALAAEAIGTALGHSESLPRGDTLPHIVLPFLSGPVLYVVLVRLGVLAEPAASPTVDRLLAAGVVTAGAVVALGVAWELVEWGADSWLGTNYSQGHQDTARDLINDSIAATASGALLVVWLRVAAGRRAWQPAPLA
jgi:hypothetical protein